MTDGKRNAILATELTAAEQFRRHAEMLAAEGYVPLAERIRERSAAAASHAASLRSMGAQAVATEPRLGRGVKSMLENDLACEQELVPMLTAAIRVAESDRELLEAMLLTAERHLDWVEAQLHLIAEIGVEDYCASQRIII